MPSTTSSPSPSSLTHQKTPFWQSSALSPQRIWGIDIARVLALLGMFAAHTLPLATPQGDSGTFIASIVSGKPSALFAVLAGVSAALATGGTAIKTGNSSTKVRISFLVRAVIVGIIGLTLGELDSGVAVILTNYALLFVLAPLLAQWTFPKLTVLATAWVLFAPLLSHLLRPGLPERLAQSPVWSDLSSPLSLVSDLVFTGYYPLIAWFGYFLAGMAIGRLRLKSVNTALILGMVGIIFSLTAHGISTFLLQNLGGIWQLNPADAPFGVPLGYALDVGFYGTTPTSSWWWLAVIAPHSGTPLDLLNTIGTAMIVIAGCLLISLKPFPILIPLVGTGSMTLSLYSLHVWILASLPEPLRHSESYSNWIFALFAVLSIGIGTLFAVLKIRGPLEAAIAGASQSVIKILVAEQTPKS